MEKPLRKRPSAARIILIVLFILYSAIMLRMLVLRGNYFNGPRVIELIPMETVQLFLRTGMDSNMFITNVWGNIGVFIPLGLFFQLFLKNKNFFLSLGLVAFTSLCAEVLQYILAVGYSDIDDLILNTLGGLVGIILFRLLRLVFKKPNRVDIASIVSIVLMSGGALYILTF